MRGRGVRFAAAATLAATAAASHALDLAWHGDVGASVVRTQGVAPGAAARTAAMPYAWGVLGTAFVREDTFGVGVLPVGWGALEIAGRISTEGSDADGPGLAHRRNPRPLGVGTFQETPWGGLFLDAFHDPVSHGSLLEASYAGELVLGPVALYPQVGVARRSARYVDHLYGATGTVADGGRASTAPMLALAGEWAFAGPWVLTGNVQREFFDAALRDQPRVAASGRTTLLLALARRFK